MIKEKPVIFNLRGNKTFKTIELNGEKLTPGKSLKLRNHSPDGFNWGYEGSGPAQLALAILLELTDQETALKWYQDFKSEVISKLHGDFNVEITYYIGSRVVLIKHKGGKNDKN